jgi:hypothetical protein
LIRPRSRGAAPKSARGANSTGSAVVGSIEISLDGKGGVVDGERSVPPAAQEGGYVPPDMVATQRFRIIPADQRAGGPEESAMSTVADGRVAPAGDALTNRSAAQAPMSVPMAAARPAARPAAQATARSATRSAAQGPDPQASGPGGPAGPRPDPAAWPSAAPPMTGTRPPRRHGMTKNMLAAAACAMGVVVIGVGVSALWPGDAPKPAASGDGTPSSSAPARTQRGAPSPGGSAAGAGSPAAARPLTRGHVVSYATTQREPGYFEGVLTLTNRTAAPLNGWQVSFTYPGASVKTVWGGVLVRAGGTATIRGAAGGASIPAGGTVRVRFGASGTPSAPRGCTLNGGPC